MASTEEKPVRMAVTLAQAESLFLARSAALLAKRFEVEAAKASEIQARLWDNPSVTWIQGAYNGTDKKWFEFSSNGETSVTAQQLIALAGKRGKAAEVERLKGRLSEYGYFDLLRALKHQLRSDFFALHFLAQTLAMYDRLIGPVGTLVHSFEEQYRKGNVALTELGRLQALLFELEDERRETSEELRGRNTDLALLLQAPADAALEPVASAEVWDRLEPGSYDADRLFAEARENRFDVKAARGQAEVDQADLSLQKSLRIPDVTLGGGWDRNGGYIHDYNFLSLSVDLPLWNRNQGNVSAAESRVRSSAAAADQAERDLRGEAEDAWQSLLEADSLYREWKEPFARDFDASAQGILQSYRKQNISLLEFVDFYQSYRESKCRLFKLQNGRMDAYENIDFTAGKDVYKFE